MMAKEKDNKRIYMAFGNTVPNVGENYNCYRLTKNLRIEGVRTATIQETMKLANNMYYVVTEDAIYIIQMNGYGEQRIQFAVTMNEPQNIGGLLKCYKMYLINDDQIMLQPKTIKAQKIITKTKNLYIIKEKNNTQYLTLAI